MGLLECPGDAMAVRLASWLLQAIGAQSCFGDQAGMQAKLLPSTSSFKVTTAIHSCLIAHICLTPRLSSLFLTTSIVRHNTSPFWAFPKEVLGSRFCVGHGREI